MHLIARVIFVSMVLWGCLCPADGLGAEGDDAEIARLDVVTVTARKTEENVRKIPVSATVISGTAIEDAGIHDMQELTRFAPNVHMTKSTSENVISMRGITSFEGSSIYSPTAVYLDDVMLPLHYAHNLDLLDVERVEILRGPQGTLYGGNSLAGVVNIISRIPDDAARFRLSGGIGAYSGVDGTPLRHTLAGSAAGPLALDRLYLGVSIGLDGGRGYMANLHTGDDRAGKTDRKNARAILRWTPDSRFDVSLIGDVLNNNDRIGYYRFVSGPYRTAPYTMSHDTDDFQKEEANGQVLRVAYTGEALKVLSVTGRRDYRNRNLQDYDGTAAPDNDWGRTMSIYDDKLISQEIRLSSVANGGPLAWLLGAYGFQEKTDISQDNEVIQQNALTNMDTKGYALFGEATYTLFDRLHLTGGLRWDARHADGVKEDHGVSLSDRMKTAELLPKVSIGYDVTDAVYGYALVSKGYLAGGYNYALGVDKETFTYDPEYIWNYEAGLKTAWFDGRLRIDLTFFYTQMKDKQVYEMISAANPVTKVDNAARAHSMGVELELQARPARGWDLFAGVGLTKAEYDDWTATEWNADYTALTRTDYSGKTIPKVPEYSGHLGVQYRHPAGLFARADVKTVGGLYVDHGNRFRENPYALVDLRLGYETEHWDIVLWGKNVFDTRYHAVAYDWDGHKLVQDGEPAIFGATMTLRF